jgi:hypothetical protein
MPGEVQAIQVDAACPGCRHFENVIEELKGRISLPVLSDQPLSMVF